MGTWGTDFWLDDTAVEVRSAYRTALQSGASDGGAAARVLADFAEALDDEDDHPIVWIALALAQSDLGRLTREARERAVELIDSNAELRRWEAAEPSAVEDRAAVLANVRGRLLGPQPTRQHIRKPSSKRMYRIGDWFAVPLRDGRSYGVGLVARANPSGALLGYFFGPRREAVPRLEVLRDLRPQQAVLVERFGDLGLRNREWPVLGSHDDWSAPEWPMPIFQMVEPLTGRHLLVTYADDDPSVCLSRRRVPAQETRGLPRDGMSGAGAVEIGLSIVLGAE